MLIGLDSSEIPPHEPGHSYVPYTIPAVTINIDGKEEHIMDSMAIATALEKYFPQEPLHLDSPMIARMTPVMIAIFEALRPEVVPKVPRNILNPVSAEYFQRERSKNFGMSLDEVEKTLGGEAAWTAAKEPIDAMVKLLTEDPSGPFYEGNKRTWADIKFVTILHFYKRVDEKTFERLLAYSKCFSDFYDAHAEFFKRDDR